MPVLFVMCFITEVVGGNGVGLGEIGVEEVGK